MHAGRVIVIVFTFCCVVALGVSIWLGITGRVHARENQSILGLRQIHEKSQRWAREHEGRYPDHIAELLTWTSLSFDDFIDPRMPDDSVWTIHTLAVRDLILSGRESPELTADREALAEAIQAVRDEPWYRFGDFFFARLLRPTGDARIVFGWTIRGVNDRRFIMFDDGSARRIEPEEWPIIWQTDATARRALEIPAIEPPAMR